MRSDLATPSTDAVARIAKRVRSSAHGFDSLTDEGLDRVIAAYEDGLRQHDAGRINYPCGSPRRTVVRWLNQARRERASRLVAANRRRWSRRSR